MYFFAYIIQIYFAHIKFRFNDYSIQNRVLGYHELAFHFRQTAANKNHRVRP